MPIHPGTMSTWPASQTLIKYSMHFRAGTSSAVNKTSNIKESSCEIKQN